VARRAEAKVAERQADGAVGPTNVGAIVLTGMEFHAFHGVHEYELERGARFVVDLEMTASPPVNDTLNETVDYSRVYASVKKIVTGASFKLIESLAAAIADAVMEAEPMVTSLVVRVHKPHAPLHGIVRDVHYELRRGRGAGPH